MSVLGLFFKNKKKTRFVCNRQLHVTVVIETAGIPLVYTVSLLQIQQLDPFSLSLSSLNPLKSASASLNSSLML